HRDAGHADLRVRVVLLRGRRIEHQADLKEKVQVGFRHGEFHLAFVTGRGVADLDLTLTEVAAEHRGLATGQADLGVHDEGLPVPGPYADDSVEAVVRLPLTKPQVRAQPLVAERMPVRA